MLNLGLVSGMIDELGLVERIDTLIPKKEQQIVSYGYGQAVKAMILNGLGFTRHSAANFGEIGINAKSLIFGYLNFNAAHFSGTNEMCFVNKSI